MENFYTTVQTLKGDVVNGATVTVYDASSGLPATIYEPDGVTPLSNPFLSGYARSEGEIEFGAANGQYNIKIVNGAEEDWIYRTTLLDAAGALLGALAYEDDASGVPITDAGGYYTSTVVEGALQEAGADLSAHLTDPTDAHDASAISILDSGGFYVATDVEEALQEIALSTPNYQYFAENRNTAAPNATIPVHQWVVDGAETSIDVAITPKAFGSILAQIPDGTLVGGDKRGSNAVDFQIKRIASTQVASGADALIPGGRQNTASGDNSTACGGLGNTASGQYSFTIGWLNTSSGVASFSGGGASTASGDYSFSFGNQATASGISSSALGSLNTASGDYSHAYGYRSTTRGLYGKHVYASGIFVGDGDAQFGKHPLRRETTDATATILTADGTTPSTANVPVLPNNHAYAITARVIGRDTTTGDIYHVIAEGTVKRGAGAATVALDGTPAYTTISKSAGASTWAVALVVNATRGSAEIQVTGEAATTIHWVCKFDTVEVG